MNSSNEHLVSDEAIELLGRMLKYDHAERITPRDAMEHSYFKPVKEYHLKHGATGMMTSGK